MSGYCSLQASLVPSSAVARCTWPSEAARAASCSKLLYRPCQSGPNSPVMRRRTNGQPIAGAFDWSWISSRTYSSGKRVGDRGEQLRHLHQRPLDAAERGLQIGGMAPAIDRHAEIALAGEPRRESAHRAADLGIAPKPAGKAVVVAHGYNLNVYSGGAGQPVPPDNTGQEQEKDTLWLPPGRRRSAPARAGDAPQST